MICKRCGERIPKGSKFCPECGHKVKRKKKTKGGNGASKAFQVFACLIALAAVLFFIIKIGNNKKPQATASTARPTPMATVYSTPIVTATPDLSKTIIGKWEVNEAFGPNGSVSLPNSGVAMFFEFYNNQSYIATAVNNGQVESTKGSYVFSNNTQLTLDDIQCEVYYSNNRLTLLIPGYADTIDGFRLVRTNSVPVAPTPINYSKVSAYQLSKEYHENEVAADNKWLNVYVEVSGKVDSVRKSFGTNYVSLNADGYGIYAIQCEFDESQANVLASIKAGQQITIRGVCRGLQVFNVYVDKCQLVK